MLQPQPKYACFRPSHSASSHPAPKQRTFSERSDKCNPDYTTLRISLNAFVSTHRNGDPK
jgi:hypothetical protein